MPVLRYSRDRTPGRRRILRLHFWLNKLNTFNGNFVQAEMVKFHNFEEYRRGLAVKLMHRRTAMIYTCTRRRPSTACTSDARLVGLLAWAPFTGHGRGSHRANRCAELTIPAASHGTCLHTGRLLSNGKCCRGGDSPRSAECTSAPGRGALPAA